MKVMTRKKFVVHHEKEKKEIGGVDLYLKMTAQNVFEDGF